MKNFLRINRAITIKNIRVYFLLLFAMLLNVRYVSAQSSVVIYQDCAKNGSVVGVKNGYTWVDLGLSVKWATCNVGATTSIEGGDLFAWGEVTPKEHYYWDTYIYRDSIGLTKYCENDTLRTLEENDDAASFNWGGGWRMPTYSEMQELINSCSWKYDTITVNGVRSYGYTITGQNGNSIYLPQAGLSMYEENYGDRFFSQACTYWSSSLFPNSYDSYWFAYRFESGKNIYLDNGRAAGRSIRPVCRTSDFYNRIVLQTSCCSNSSNTFFLPVDTSLTISAIPNEGYHFTQWNDGNTENPRSITITQDTTFTAEFAKNTYTISTTSANPEWGTTAGDTAALYLDTVSISAIPNYGYHFVKWDGDDIIDNSITVATAISIASELPTNSESDIYTIVGYVVGKYNYYDNLLYKIADTPNGGNTFLIYTGSQSVSIGDYISITGHIYKSSDLQYAYGDTQQVSFIKITNNLYNVVVKKNATYEAVFAKNVYSITKNAEHGSISGNSSAEYLDFVTLTVTPDYGYHFTQWSDGNTDNPRVFQITKDTTFTAEFAYDRVGTCGKDLALVWSYDPTKKVLTIGNSGEFTENMQFGVEAPNEMEELVIGNSVTAIGENAFAGISTLKKVTIGESVKTIHNNAFYNCVNLETIFNYRQTPTNAYSTAFDGVDKFECKLYVLPSSIDMYKAAAVWRDFYYTYAIGAVETTVTTNDVTVEPQDNAAIVTWPTSNNAATYTIQITKDGVVFCTLIFNANGQLTGIAFAPSRDGSHHAPAAIMTANGLQFTVTGLDSNTQYGYNLTAKDANDQTIATYSGSFTTTSEGETTGVEEVSSSLQGGDRGRLILRNGQVFILRGDKTYTLTGQETIVP